MSPSEPQISGLFQIEAVLRLNASALQMLELDSILVNMEVDEALRVAQAHSFIETFVEKVRDAG